MWFQFANGEAREIVADLELADVRTKLGDGLPELDLAHVSGRVGWRTTADEREIFTQALAFTTVGGERLDPTNLKLTLREGAGRPSGQIEFDHLQLAPLRRARSATCRSLPAFARISPDSRRAERSSRVGCAGKAGPRRRPRIPRPGNSRTSA